VSNPAVYAAGDAVAIGGFPLTPVAGMQGAIVASNLLKGNHRTPNYAGTPSVVFTTPPLARVGLTEEAARRRGLALCDKPWRHVRPIFLTTGSRATHGFQDAGRGGDRADLGAHLLGLHAEEVINLFGLAIRTGIRATDLKYTVFAYPTSASDLG